ncbi:hypothetical protein EJB05_58079, partial [Eragrostis curvula]
MAPMLDSMQSLVDAYVKIDWLCFDECKLRPADCQDDCDCDSCERSDNSNDYQEDCDCNSCGNNRVLLKGLSEAVNLTMISETTKYPQHKVQFEGSVDPTLRYAASEHLTVQVMCNAVDERILKLLKFLGMYTCSPACNVIFIKLNEE